MGENSAATRIHYTSDVRVAGRSFSNWWLLLALPALVLLGFLVLPFILFATQGISGIVLGPPAIWKRPWHTPPRQDLIGKYFESERHWDGTGRYTKALLELRANGTMTVSDLPLEVGENTCMLTGTGTWEGPDNERGINLTFVPVSGTSNVCQQGVYSGFDLAGHAKPYLLYWTLGDPDSETGVWLTRK